MKIPEQMPVQGSEERRQVDRYRPLDLIGGLPGKDGLQWGVKRINPAVTLANDQNECD